MCLGSIARLDDAWGDGAVRAGRLDDGSIVPLAYVPDALPGSHLLLHLGIPVEVLHPDAARDALALRAAGASDLRRETT